MADGVMEQIRGLLRAGKTSGEIIALGYAPGTVYKVQRRWRRGDGAASGGAGIAQRTRVLQEIVRGLREVAAEVQAVDATPGWEEWADPGGQHGVAPLVREAHTRATQIRDSLAWWRGWV